MISPQPSVIRKSRVSLLDWPRREAWAGVAAGLLLLLWIGEVFAIQELTLYSGHHQSAGEYWLHRSCRFGLEISAVLALYWLLPRSALATLFPIQLFFNLMVLLYHDYYSQPLSALVVLNQSGEGAAVASAIVSLLQPSHLSWVAICGAKLALLWLARPPGLTFESPARAAWLRAAARWATPNPRRGFAVLAVYLAGLWLLNPTVKLMRKIATWESVGGIGAVYGYLPTWIAELVHINEGLLLERAYRRGEQLSDRLTPRETALEPPQKLVLLQVESLDWAILDFRIDGKAVTPALNGIAEKSLLFAVRPEKRTGSCDADFIATMGKLPSEDVPNYKILGYSYAGSFVERLGQSGWHTAFYHGVTGAFFNRRPAYAQMGFDELWFREEFLESGDIPVRGWTVDDADLLMFVGQQFAARSGKQFAFMITASCHIPFPVPAGRRLFFPDSEENNERYFDSQHHTDAAIGALREQLPDDALLVIYGDHVSQIENAALGYHQGEVRGEGLVPFIVHQVGTNLRKRQQSGELATSGSLTLLDAMRWLHRQALQ